MPERKRILFVDDDLRVLEGLRRQLRVLREEWDMDFVSSGPQALDLMEKQHFDVVVSDMRMPGMDGAELLGHIARKWPETIRVILSGYTDYEYLLKSVGAAHRYLAKPCDPEVLRSTIKRALGLRNLLENERLKKLISRLEKLPSAPSLFQKLMTELRSPSSTAESVGRIIEEDPAMTAKILQLVNSAFFGLRQPVSRAARAVSLLGIETIRSLALSLHAFAEFDGARSTLLPLETLWDHALTTAVLARTIARSETDNRHVIDECFTAGLLHDVGILALAANLPEEYNKIFEESARCRQFVDAEEDKFGAGHPEVGAYLLGLWGLPDPIVEAAAYHHRPAQWAGREFSTVVAVHAADAFAWELRAGIESGLPPSQLSEEFLEAAGVRDRVSAWRKSCEKILEARFTGHEQRLHGTGSPC